MAGGGKTRGQSGQAQRGASRDLLWIVPFGLLVAGGLLVALLTSGSEQPPLPTFSPTPQATEPTEELTPEDEGPSEQPTATERKAAFRTVRTMALLDGELLLGAEDGPWLLGEDGTPRPAPGPRHRFSALAAADGALFGSGLREDGAAPLGLAARGEDGTWTSVALGGQALFGKLRVQGPRVYGWDAGSSGLLVSQDLQNWETRSVEQRLLDFAVHPEDGERLVRAVPEGGVGLPEVQESRDGGRTWKRISAPSLFLFSWRAADRLWALTEDGTIFRSRDGGHSWSPRNQLPAPPTALLDTGQALYVALQEVGVYRSTDDARTWERLDQS